MKKMPDFYLKKIYTLIIILMLPGIFLAGKSVAQKKDKGQPDVKIDVKKEYDEKGNMVLYDSTYSWSWSGNSDDMDLDSLLEKFHHHLEIYNLYDDDFFPHAFMFPESPDSGRGSFFGPEDSTRSWEFGSDTTLKNYFFDDFFNRNFPSFDNEYLKEFFNDFLFGFHAFPGMPESHSPSLSPEDTTGSWYGPFDKYFPDDYLKELDRSIQEMRKYFEKNNMPSPFLDNYFLYYDLRDKDNNRQKKNPNTSKT